MILEALFLVAQIIPVIPAVAAAGCNDTEFDTWDNLTGWSQSGSDFTADATNDELDYSSAGSNDHWLRYDTATTDSDNCVALCLNTDLSANVEGFVALVRAGNSNNEDAYSPTYWWSGNYTGVFNLGPSNMGWVADPHSGLTFPKPDAGDCVAYCVSNTSTSTKFEAWHWNETGLPGNCRTDWPTSTSGARTYLSNTGCGGDCWDQDERMAGLGMAATAAAATVSIDKIIISDYVE
ncbi:MAG: hypothetical protein ACYSUI_18755 [Planctomycetota bacterium]|jgi:hypothetical protein